MSLSEELAGAASAAGASAAVSTPSGRVSYMICWSHHDIFAPSLSQGMVRWNRGCASAVTWNKWRMRTTLFLIVRSMRNAASG